MKKNGGRKSRWTVPLNPLIHSILNLVTVWRTAFDSKTHYPTIVLLQKFLGNTGILYVAASRPPVPGSNISLGHLHSAVWGAADDTVNTVPIKLENTRPQWAIKKKKTKNTCCCNRHKPPLPRSSNTYFRVKCSIHGYWICGKCNTIYYINSITRFSCLTYIYPIWSFSTQDKTVLQTFANSQRYLWLSLTQCCPGQRWVKLYYYSLFTARRIAYIFIVYKDNDIKDSKC